MSVEEASRSRAWRSGRRLVGVDGEGKSGFQQHVDGFVGQFEIADDVVVEVLGAGAVVPDVVVAPATSEVPAAGEDFRRSRWG